MKEANKEIQDLTAELDEITAQNTILKQKTAELLDRNDELSDVVAELSKYYVHIKKASAKSDGPAAVQDMIAANMGVGFWPEHSWGKIKNTKIKLLPIRDPECSRDLIVCYNERSNSNYALDFYRFFTNMLKKM